MPISLEIFLLDGVWRTGPFYCLGLHGDKPRLRSQYLQLLKDEQIATFLPAGQAPHVASAANTDWPFLLGGIETAIKKLEATEQLIGIRTHVRIGRLPRSDFDTVEHLAKLARHHDPTHAWLYRLRPKRSRKPSRPTY